MSLMSKDNLRHAREADGDASSEPWWLALEWEFPPMLHCVQKWEGLLSQKD